MKPLAALVALALVACGKVEAPAEVVCVEGDVTVALVDPQGQYTVFNQELNGKTYRFTRPGVLGAPGDRFSVCR